MHAIETQGLTKSYGRQQALCGLDFCVPTGSLFGFLGPNGAGKTTMIRVLLGLLHATGGRVRVLGRDPWRDGPALRAQIGYLPGDVRFYDNLTGRATLQFVDAAHGGRCWPEVRRLAELLSLDLDRRVRSYSRGMKQKLGLIVALLHRPQLVILDEPTTALDPLVREALAAELRSVVAAGRTVLFSSHTLAEVEELCDEVAILRDGQLVVQDRIDALRRRAVRRVELRFGAGRGPLPPMPDGLRVLSQTDAGLRATWNGPAPELLNWLSRCPIEEAVIAPPDLDDLFRTYYAQAAGAHA